MGDNEAYLDSLLKSMNGDDSADGNDGNKMMSADEIAAMFAAMEQSAPIEEPEVALEEQSAPIEEPEAAVEEQSAPIEEPEVALEEQSAPIEELEAAVEEQSAPIEEPEAVSEESVMPMEEPVEDSMELPEDLLNDLLQKFEEQEAEEVDEKAVQEDTSTMFEEEAPLDILAEIAKMEEEEAAIEDSGTESAETTGDFQETYTTESTQNLSAEEIEQLLAATEQQAENDIVENAFNFSEEEASVDDMSHDDLLALLGGLDGEPEEVGLFSEQEEMQGETFQGDEINDLLSGVAVAERAKERKERKKKEKLEKQAAKKALKEATKEAKKAQKEAKRQQTERQRITEDEMTLEEVSLEETLLAEADGTESVLDLFGNTDSEGETVNIFDIAGVSEDDTNSSQEQAEVVMSWDELDEEQDATSDTSDNKKTGATKSKGNNTKKGGLFSKIFAFLTEEDEEPVKADENQFILDELEAEDKEEEKKNKGKKGKAAKGKKGKDEAEGEDEEKGDKKKEKKKKKPKPKKVKEIKLKPIEEERPSKRVSPKSVAVIIAFAATIFLVVFFASSYFSTQLHRNGAKAAFERMDYASCYASLYGMELSEEEKEMLKHAELVLKMQRHIELYETYHEDEKELEALDSLMQAVAEYEDTYAKALDCGAGAEVAALYEEVLDILQTSYGVSQEEAHTIATCESNVEYTRYLTALIGGGDDPGISVPEEEWQDVLPEEEELANPDFAD